MPTADSLCLLSKLIFVLKDLLQKAFLNCFFFNLSQPIFVTRMKVEKLAILGTEFAVAVVENGEIAKISTPKPKSLQILGVTSRTFLFSRKKFLPLHYTKMVANTYFKSLGLGFGNLWGTR